jgi:nitrite reductase (NO-forming)
VAGRSRDVARTANLLGRLWLIAAAASLTLPAHDRLGVWLPLHLALAGAAVTTISGNMQMFASTLTATPSIRPAVGYGQLVLVNVGTLLITLGLPISRPVLVVAGGCAFGIGVLLLGVLVRSAMRRSLNRRHVLPLVLYLAAVACALVGVAIGATLGSGVVHHADVYLALRRAHVTLNLLGFVSLTIAGTLLTLLPTILRTRMVARGGWLAGWLLGVGTVVLAGGFAAQAWAVADVGAITYACGALVLGSMAAVTIRTVIGRRGAPPALTAAAHVVAALLWFCSGAIALAVIVVSGGDVETFLPPALAIFALGWTVQMLLGAWSYLIPSAAPGGPGERRAYFAVMDAGGLAQAAALNAGLALVALRAAGLVGSTAGVVGMWVALVAGGVAVARTWLYRPLARSGWASRRADRLFGP